MVQSVERFDAELEPSVFCDPDVLQQGCVDVEERRRIDDRASHRSCLTRLVDRENRLRTGGCSVKNNRTSSVRANDVRIDPVYLSYGNAELVDYVPLEVSKQVVDVAVRKARISSLTSRAGRTVQSTARIDERDRNTGVPRNDAREFPTAEDAVNPSALIEKRFPFPKRKLVHAVEVERMLLIEIGTRVVQPRIRI